MRVFCRSYPDSFIDEHPKTALEVLLSFVFFLIAVYTVDCILKHVIRLPRLNTAVNLDSQKRFDGLRFTFKCVVFKLADLDCDRRIIVYITVRYVAYIISGSDRQRYIYYK